MLTDEENHQVAEIAYEKFGTRDIIVRLNQRNNSQKIFWTLVPRLLTPQLQWFSLLDQFVRSPQAASLLLGMEKGKRYPGYRIAKSRPTWDHTSGFKASRRCYYSVGGKRWADHYYSWLYKVEDQGYCHGCRVNKESESGSAKI